MRDPFTDITIAVRQLLERSGMELRYLKMTDDLDSVIKPTFYISIDDGAIEKSGGISECTPTVLIDVAFGNLRSDDRRRLGIYPLLWALITLLADVKLTIEENGIESNFSGSHLTAGSFRKKFENDACIIYTIPCTITTRIQKPDPDDDAGDLLTLGVEYYLKSSGTGDDIPDAVDVIPLRE